MGLPGEDWRGPGAHRGRPAPPPDFRRPRDWDRPYGGRFVARWHYSLPPVRIVRVRTQPAPPPLGAVVIGSDDTFLGVISLDTNDPDSLSNPEGRFGSPYSPSSIWNPEGQWGAETSSLSPWSLYTTRPPVIYYANAFWGYLTANVDLYPSVSPSLLADRLDIRLW